jgi:RNA polymerase sigma factor (sigma-70 family)
MVSDAGVVGLVPSEVLVRWCRQAWCAGDRDTHNEVCALLFDRLRLVNRRWAAMAIARSNVHWHDRKVLAEELYADLCERLIHAWRDPARAFWEISFGWCLRFERRHVFKALMVREGWTNTSTGKARPARVPRPLMERLDGPLRQEGEVRWWACEREDERAMREMLAIEQHALLLQLVAALPVKLRQVMYLRFVLEHKEKEVAALLGVTDRTVRNRIQSAFRMLRVGLGVGEVCGDVSKQPPSS